MTTFDIPEGYKMPDGVENGQEFDEVCTLKFSEDGKIILLAVDGNTLGKDADKERKKTKPKGMMEKVKEMGTMEEQGDEQ